MDSLRWKESRDTTVSLKLGPSWAVGTPGLMSPVALISGIYYHMPAQMITEVSTSNIPVNGTSITTLCLKNGSN